MGEPRDHPGKGHAQARGKAPPPGGKPLERIRTLLRARAPVYRKAHIHVSTDGRRVEEVVEEIVEKLWRHAEARGA